jgi:hypothetical protein
MGEGSGALLEVWGFRWVCSQKVSSSGRRQNWFKYQSRCGSTLLGEEPVRCHRLLVNWFLNKITEEMSFIKKGGHYKEEVDRP